MNTSKRIYVKVSPSQEDAAYEQNLTFDRRNDRFYTTEDNPNLENWEVDEFKPAFSVIPADQRLYLKTEYSDIAMLKQMQCRYEGKYRLWYTYGKLVDGVLEVPSRVMKVFEPYYSTGHRLSPYPYKIV